MEQFFCEHPDHLGERRVPDVADQCLVTVDIMRENNAHRMARVSPRLAHEPSGPRRLGGFRICVTCAERVEAALLAGAAVLDVAVGYEAPVQAGLL